MRPRGNYVGVIMGREYDSPEHQMLSGCGGRAPDAVTTRRQGTKRCHDGQGKGVCARLASGFRVETKANQDATSDRRGVLIRN